MAGESTLLRDGQDDSVLVIDAAAGDADAFAVLFRRHGPDVLKMVQRRSGSAAVADDVVAVVFERAWLALGDLRDRRVGFRPWVFRVAVNELIDVQRSATRRRGREQRVALADAPTSTPDVPGESSDVAVRGVSAEALRSALSSLSAPHQEVLTLRFFGHLEPTEVARTLGVATGTVAVRTHRAMAALRRELGVAERGVST